MNLEEIKTEYDSLSKNYDEVKSTHFTKNLVKSNQMDVLDFHYSILNKIENKYLFYEVRGVFNRHGEAGKLYLLDKLQTESNINLKAEALFILGSFDTRIGLNADEAITVKEIAKDFISQKTNHKTQEYGSDVLGWLGNKEDLLILDKEMRENKNAKMRGGAAGSMLQIWFNNPRLKKMILKYYYIALPEELDYYVNGVIIDSIQEILQKKLGIKMDKRGEISGDIELSKPKAIKAIEKLLNN